MEHSTSRDPSSFPLSFPFNLRSFPPFFATQLPLNIYKQDNEILVLLLMTATKGKSKRHCCETHNCRISFDHLLLPFLFLFCLFIHINKPPIPFHPKFFCYHIHSFIIAIITVKILIILIIFIIFFIIITIWKLRFLLYITIVRGPYSWIFNLEVLDFSF